ncbi:uncharacterized protein EV420DRAFT_1479189 [Desarmillaria tabescens]|uniref:F-box domain-containing protein n=1 Tax=Armillaria tabescens TaxID=1929756 RepID=A0AA39N602_ARMTA|nr:uncharacterized protein EV420DRAFT_1479189 [Desarmillaria tabescens]KAK0459167.1 hypothetical protein EV420DRAFT_1479189 [Desarmillaria tabescens]
MSLYLAQISEKRSKNEVMKNFQGRPGSPLVGPLDCPGGTIPALKALFIATNIWIPSCMMGRSILSNSAGYHVVTRSFQGTLGGMRQRRWYYTLWSRIKHFGRHRHLPDDTVSSLHNEPDIDRLSDATLLRIFVFTQSTYASPLPERAISHVNRRWREIVLEHAALWRQIDAKVLSSSLQQDIIEAYLSRARTFTADLRVVLSENEWIRTLEIIAEHSARWRLVSIRADFNFSPDLLSQHISQFHLPHLEHLSIICLDRFCDPPDLDTIDGDTSILRGSAPRLTSFRVQHSAITYFPPPLHGLTTLHLEELGGHRIDYTSFRRLILSIYSLTNLSIYGDFIDHWTMTGDLRIPALRSLRSGSNASLGAMLLSLSVPGLASLTLYNAWDSHIQEFIRQREPGYETTLPCVHLMLKDCHFSLPSLRTLLEEVPAIYRLDIIDGFADEALDLLQNDNALLPSLCALSINRLRDPTKLSTFYNSRKGKVAFRLHFDLDAVPPPDASSVRWDRLESWPAGTKCIDRDDFMTRLSDTGVAYRSPRLLLPHTFIINNYDDDIRLGIICDTSTLVDPGPCAVNDLSDALLLSIFELTSDSYGQSYPSVVRRICHVNQRWRKIVTSSPKLWRHIDAIVPNVYNQLALINMHLIKAYPLTVDLRLALPNVESEWALLLEPLTYSSSRWRVLSIHVDSDSDWGQHALVRHFRTSHFPNLEHFSVIRYSDVSSCNCFAQQHFGGNILLEGSPRLSSVRLQHSSIPHLLPPPQSISTLHLEQFGEYPMEYGTFRRLIMGLPSLANLSIYGNFVDGWTKAGDLVVPGLRTLRLSNNEALSALLLSIYAPNLESLEFHAVWDSHLRDFLHEREKVYETSVHYLMLKGCRLSTDSLSALFKDFSGTERVDILDGYADVVMDLLMSDDDLLPSLHTVSVHKLADARKLLVARSVIFRLHYGVDVTRLHAEVVRWDQLDPWSLPMEFCDRDDFMTRISEHCRREDDRKLVRFGLKG